MTSPTNARLDALLTANQGRRLVLVSGGGVSDLFVIGEMRHEPLVPALMALGRARGYEIGLSLDAEGRLEFADAEAEARFDAITRDTTRPPDDGEEWSALEPPAAGAPPRGPGSAPASHPASAPASDPGSDRAGQPPPGPPNARLARVANLLGLLHRAFDTDTRVLAVFTYPEELWFRDFTEPVLDLLRRLTAIARARAGHPASRLVLVTRPGRRDEFAAALERAEATAPVRLDLVLGPPQAPEVSEYLNALLRRGRVAGDTRRVAAEWQQRGLYLHALCEAVNRGKGLDRRLETILDDGAAFLSKAAVAAELEALVGLAGVKAQLRDLLDTVERQALARLRGESAQPITTHLLFLGSPGTGKTVVARLVGRWLQAIGLRSGATFVEISRTDVVSSYNSGECIERMRGHIERATGGVLFVDEAYQLAQGEWMRGALETLMKEMEDRRDTLTVILAGYERQMQGLWSVNPGFRSRIPEANWVRFPDYSAAELTEVFCRMLAERDLALAPEAPAAARRFIEDELRRGRFGNARGARHLVDAVVQRAAARDRRTITADLVPEPIRYQAQEVARLRRELLADLKGLEQVPGVARGGHRKTLSGYLDAQDARAQRVGRDQSAPWELPHCFFLGPPGSGKTTAARQLGRILNAMGLLTRGHLVEINPMGDFASAFAGDFAVRVAERFAEAQGGVLFIDEAYQLADDPQGRQIVNQIVQRLTAADLADTVVILAGYRDRMERLFEVNPGLKDRVPNEVHFPEPDTETLVEIFFHQVDGRENYVVDPDQRADFDAWLRRKIDALRVSPHFAYARSIKNFAREVVERQNLRVRRDPRAPPWGLLVDDLGELPPHLGDVRRLLDGLDDRYVGLAGAKAVLRSLAYGVQVRRVLGGAPGVAPRLLFLGNPGTGKTSLGRDLGRLLVALGVVVNDNFVETRGVELKGSFLGQTKERVVDTFKDARGGVLFIDEVYALASTEHSQDSYAREAVETIVGQVQLPVNGQTAVVLAGYRDRMETLLDSNPGLASRFPARVPFDDYSPADCLAILKTWLPRSEPGIQLPADPAVDAALLRGFADKRERARDFGNARAVEALGALIVEARNQRLYRLLEEQGEAAIRREDAALVGVRAEDVTAALQLWLGAAP